VARRFARARLTYGHGTDNASDEAAWLVAAVAGVAPAELARHRRRRLTPAERARLHTLMRARIDTRKPLAYLLEHAWFAGERFYVDERAIVPRSHLAEFIRERLQPWIDPARVRRILDVGTGSGCIALAAARAFPAARVDAADISADALAVAATNRAQRPELARRVRLVESDLFAALGQERYDVILSNPPYVAPTALARLPAEYRHEPAVALAGGRDGLAIVCRLLAAAGEHLAPGGVLLVETGNSAERLQRRFPRIAFTWLTTVSGDESVFLLTREQCVEHRAAFAAAR